jgi:hypothetical protein
MHLSIGVHSALMCTGRELSPEASLTGTLRRVDFRRDAGPTAGRRACKKANGARDTVGDKHTRAETV